MPSGLVRIRLNFVDNIVEAPAAPPQDESQFAEVDKLLSRLDKLHSSPVVAMQAAKGRYPLVNPLAMVMISGAMPSWSQA